MEKYMAKTGNALSQSFPPFYISIAGQVTSAVFAAALVEYLSNGNLLGLPQASQILGSTSSFGSSLMDMITP